jgi:hypothetical protein
MSSEDSDNSSVNSYNDNENVDHDYDSNEDDHSDSSNTQKQNLHQQPESKVPISIQFDSHIFNIAMHPSDDIIASSLITGEVQW